MTTLLLHHSDFLEHLTAPGHPERPDRLKALHAALDHEAFAGLAREEAPMAEPEIGLLAHPEAYVDKVRSAIPEVGLARIDADTVVSPGSWNAAMRGLGAVCRAVDTVNRREFSNAFVALRPPGHHAERDQAMGFCIFNNAAIAARYAQREHGMERVAIVDWDVHHGNGTQDIFWTDPSVLYCSTHQMPLYPGTGALTETGAGNICNAPLSAGDGTEMFREAFCERILPRVKDFAPDLIIVSAGFDAHQRDPLAEINLSHEDFAWATGKLMDLADHHCEGRLVSLLEGGYDLRGLAVSAAAHIRMLMSA
ncbi:histone deacetylase family protein [Afifella sp. IM 167]|uniref:histone deacetylase family protein n=1 Tax=Afifella sp. IM 167 TaxID=2033586 RepID=UPI001CC9F2C7